MRVYVEYTVPVLVEVDLEADAVVAVHVDDEQVEGPASVIPLDEPVSARDTARATALAEEDPWPAWEFGL